MKNNEMTLEALGIEVLDSRVEMGMIPLLETQGIVDVEANLVCNTTNGGCNYVSGCGG